MLMEDLSIPGTGMAFAGMKKTGEVNSVPCLKDTTND
jgi:cytochrome c2